MKLSLTGYSVPWITKTSRPRTFSRTRTKTFPSPNCKVSDFARPIPSFSQTALPKLTLALPAKSFSSP